MILAASFLHDPAYWAFVRVALVVAGGGGFAVWLRGVIRNR